jgi:hypothetical protein
VLVRIASLPPWVRYGLITGVIAFAATLAANLAIIFPRPSDLCRVGPLILLLLNLGALAVFVWMAASAGFASARAEGSVSKGTLAGVLVGAISGCALLALIFLAPSVIHRLAELSPLCPQTGSIGSGGAPPPGVSLTPPPEAFSQPFSSPGATAGYIAGMIGSILTGLALAAGIASLAGLIGLRLPRKSQP